MPRPRKYSNDNARKAAYRERLSDLLHRAQAASNVAPAPAASASTTADYDALTKRFETCRATYGACIAELQAGLDGQQSVPALRAAITRAVQARA
jgi:hypothetical protein